MESLRKNADFRKCYESGRSFANKYLVLYVCGNGLGKNRIGISVSKKVGNSVVRHRTARLIREACRLNEGRFAAGHDLVFVARVRSKEVVFSKSAFSTIEGAVLRLSGRAGVSDGLKQ